MMTDTSRITHSAGCDYDLGGKVRVKEHGFRAGLGEVEIGKIQRITAVKDLLFRDVIEVLSIPSEDHRRTDGHGTVYVNVNVLQEIVIML